MQTTNPFPGMNPFLEGVWQSVHVALLAQISDKLFDELPADLIVRPEEDIVIEHDGESLRVRADAAIHEHWQSPLPGVWQPEGEAAIAVAEPEIITIEPPPQRWIEIRDVDGRLVTVIELISPANKEGEGRETYLKKQASLLAAGVNLVEVDLIRRGRRVWSEEVTEGLRINNRSTYLIVVSRATQPTQREVYYCPLREPLPAIRVPLRSTDRDVPLALQPLVDRIYQRGSYWTVSRDAVPEPRLPADDAAWVEEQLTAAGLK